jgi:hypothetical protein
MQRSSPSLTALALALALAPGVGARQNGADVPTMSNADAPTTAHPWDRQPLQPGLTLGQLQSVAQDHWSEGYSLGGLRLLDVYEGTKGISPVHWVFEVVEPATGQRTFGISANTFCFYTRNTEFAKSVRAAMARNRGMKVSVVFRFGRPYLKGRGDAEGGDVSRVSFFDPATNKRVEDVDNDEAY